MSGVPEAKLHIVSSTARSSANAFYAGPDTWNLLPVRVREEMDFHRFKRLLTHF